VPRWKNGWSCTSIPQYAFMAWCPVRGSTGTTTIPVHHYRRNSTS
jgi:hypothetical protein